MDPTTFDRALASCKSLLKIALQSRRKGRIKPQADPQGRIIILGNGPSLNDSLDAHRPILEAGPAMAVNFAANSPVFSELKPEFYIMVDPHFFAGRAHDPNVEALYQAFERVSWPITLIIPARQSVSIANPNVKVLHINDIGVEGASWLEDWALHTGRAMPRPRNVLIAAISAAIMLGFKQIDLVGADHSWLRTLDVDEQNRVVSIQPHFYKEAEGEKERQAAVYANVTLPQILDSFRIAFASYHQLQRHALRHNIQIRNCTPASMIDAFPRATLQ